MGSLLLLKPSLKPSCLPGRWRAEATPSLWPPVNLPIWTYYGMFLRPNFPPKWKFFFKVPRFYRNQKLMQVGNSLTEIFHPHAVWLVFPLLTSILRLSMIIRTFSGLLTSVVRFNPSPKVFLVSPQPTPSLKSPLTTQFDAFLSYHCICRTLSFSVTCLEYSYYMVSNIK